MHHKGVPWAWYPALHLLLLAVTWSWSDGGAEGLTSLKIGALLAFNSTIGQVALAALQGAVLDVNANSSLLSEYELSLHAVDTSCNAFQGAAAAVEVWKEDVVAVAGPQTSLMAQFAADVGAATKVPVVSFVATDPALTKTSNRYFLRTAHSDAVQMKTLAALIELYGWREVSAVSTDDYVGLNSLEVLSDALYHLDVDLVYKATISRDTTAREMVGVLNGLAMQESRVIVVHLQPSLGRLLFTTAQSMSMMTTGFVWLMSEAMSGLLEDMSPSDSLWTAIQGVVAVRSYIPPSARLSALQSRWDSPEFMNSSTPTAAKPLNIYGMYAYDTLWVIAQAMDNFVRSGKNFTFARRAALTTRTGGGTDLASLKILKDGDSFFSAIRDIRIFGASGLIEFDSDGDLVGSVYEILNLIGRSPRVIGFWDVDQGFSPVFKSNNSHDSNGPTSPKGATKNTGQLQDVIWPGGSAQVPKGWVVAKNGQKLTIGVPLKKGFSEFVDIVTDASNVTTVRGFCIDVFEAAVSYLAYPLNFTYVPYGNGISTPSYDDLVNQIVDKTFDAVVGDVTITMKRSKTVDFTQPYTTSGLVVVVPTKAGGSSAGDFIRPFTPVLWVTTFVFFLYTGVAIWILEHKKNEEFQNRPKEQIVTVLWFIFSTPFFVLREQIKSTSARAVLLIWLFVVLILISSYTASLASLLTVQQLVPTIQGIAGLVSSDLKIGYQSGSFAKDYLLQLNVPRNRLVPLENQTAYADALTKGLVGGVVDERPYIELFLSDNCAFTIAGQEFTKSGLGWGFVFPKGSQLAVDMSTAILQMAEDGQLQKIYDSWLGADSFCPSEGFPDDPHKLGLSTFWVLFLITGVATTFLLILHYARPTWQHSKAYADKDMDEGTVSDRSMTRSSRNERSKIFPRSPDILTKEIEITKRGAEVGSSSKNSLRRNSKRYRKSADLDSDSQCSEPLAEVVVEQQQHSVEGM